MQTKNKRDPLPKPSLLSPKFLSLAVAFLLPPSVPPRLCPSLRRQRGSPDHPALGGLPVALQTVLLPSRSPLLNSPLPTGLLSAAPPHHPCRHSSPLGLECWPCCLLCAAFLPCQRHRGWKQPGAGYIRSVAVLALPLPRCVSLSKLLNLLGLRFLVGKWGRGKQYDQL